MTKKQQLSCANFMFKSSVFVFPFKYANIFKWALSQMGFGLEL